MYPQKQIAEARRMVRPSRALRPDFLAGKIKAGVF